MGREYQITSEGTGVRIGHAEAVAAWLRKAASYAGAVGSGEFWLRDPQAASPWPYDARVFVRETALWIEVSTESAGCLRDLAALEAWLGTWARVRRDDGED